MDLELARAQGPKFNGERGEDRAIASVVSNEPPSFFVDVGAYDGIRDSNTHYFELIGWKGICIEPHPDYFPLCVENRPNSQCLNLAAWNIDGESTEFYATYPGGASRIGRLDELKKTLEIYSGIKVGAPIRVQTRTLDSIFREHEVPRGFGLLSVDVEGTEMQVLRGMNLENYLPRFVIVEYNHIEGERSRIPRHRPPQVLYDYFGTCGYVGVNNSGSHNVIFCRDREDAEKVALNWRWKGARGFIEDKRTSLGTIGIYVIAPWAATENEHAFLRGHSPDDSGRWDDIELCEKINDADLYIVFWGGGPNPYHRMKKCPAHSVLNFTRESSRMAQNPRLFGEETIYCQWPSDRLNLQIWGGDGAPNSHERMKHYSDLNGTSFPKKTGLLSWITTGDYSLPRERDRIDFMRKFTEEYPGVLDLYGRNTGEFDLSSIDTYKGPLVNNRGALDPYEYTFAFENICEPNYMSEKFNDAILAGCIPIYRGMPNIAKYYPENSFVAVNITREDAPQKVMKILDSDYRKQNIEALYKAKDLLLNKYQFWPALHGLIHRLIGDGTIDLDKLERRRNEEQYIY